jgi:fibronectin type III domain protein
MAYDAAMASVRFAMLLAASATLTACAGGGNGTAALSWSAPTRNVDGSPVGPIAGYYIYYGASPMAMSHTIEVSDPRATSYVVRHLSPGPYYFSVAAYSASGARGLQTEPVSKTILK